MFCMVGCFYFSPRYLIANVDTKKGTSEKCVHVKLYLETE